MNTLDSHTRPLEYLRNNAKEVGDLIQNTRFTYEFMEPEAFISLQTEPATFYRVLWEETLQRVHFCACSALLRLQQWARGLETAYNSENPFLTAAALRGLIESSADTNYSLFGLPFDLSDRNRMDIINRILMRKWNANEPPVIPSEEMENRLIHFSHGRRLTKDEKTQLPSSHSAVENWKYIRTFEDYADSIYHIYQNLCEITHPASGSIGLFLREDETAVRWSKASAREKCNLVSNVDSKIFDVMITYPANLSLFCLKVLNSYQIERLHSPFLDNISFEGMPLGRKIRDALRLRHW